LKNIMPKIVADSSGIVCFMRRSPFGFIMLACVWFQSGV